LRLVIVPRHPQRFDEVANLITSSGFDLIRRSAPMTTDNGQLTTDSPIILGDTMGELRKFYSLADVVFVGRTLVDLGPRQHGSDMIEPAALAKPVIVGPYTGNFADVMARFRVGQAMIEVTTGQQLGQAVGELLASTEKRAELGRAAQQVVTNEKGATERHVRVILGQLKRKSHK
jgi:3-deoxy-D-manno-octulosonic-acid transferase